MENLQSPYGGQISGRPFSPLQHQETQNALHWRQLNEDTDQMNSQHPYASPAQFRDPPLQTQPARMEDLWRFDGANMFLVSETPAAASQIKLQLLQSLPPFDSNITSMTSVRQSGPNQTCIKQNPPFTNDHHVPKIIKPVPLFTDISPSLHVPYVIPHLNALWPVLVPHMISNASVPHQNLFCPIYMPRLNFTPPFASNLTLVPLMDPACSCRVFQPHMSVSVHPHIDEPAWGRQQHSSGDAKTAGNGCAETLVQDLPERALSEYTQIMDALESEVSHGSEVTAADEEDVCALYLNQLFKPGQIPTESGFDMDSVNSLLSADHIIADVLRESSQDMFSSVTPEPVAGCSGWTQDRIPSSSALRCDFRTSDSTDLHSPRDQITRSASDASTGPGVWPQDDVVQNDGQRVFQTSAVLPEPLLANPEGRSSETRHNASVPETIHPAPQDFGPETQEKDEASFVVELDSAAQSNESHRATFTQTIQHHPDSPESPADGGTEHDGEENVAVRQRTEKCQHVSSDNSNKTTDIPNENKSYKTQHRRWKLQKITPAPKSDDKDERNKRPRKTQERHSATKHRARAQETHFIQTNPANVTSAADRRKGSLRQHDGQIRDTRGENVDEEFERRQRMLKTIRSRKVGEQRMANRDGNDGETYGRAEGGRLATGENRDRSAHTCQKTQKQQKGH